MQHGESETLKNLRKVRREIERIGNAISAIRQAGVPPSTLLGLPAAGGRDRLLSPSLCFTAEDRTGAEEDTGALPEWTVISQHQDRVVAEVLFPRVMAVQLRAVAPLVADRIVSETLMAPKCLPRIAAEVLVQHSAEACAVDDLSSRLSRSIADRICSDVAAQAVPRLARSVLSAAIRARFVPHAEQPRSVQSWLAERVVGEQVKASVSVLVRSFLRHEVSMALASRSLAETVVEEAVQSVLSAVAQDVLLATPVTGRP